MVLADTSIWIWHFRTGHAILAALLEDNAVLTHPMVIGELACGNLKNRAAILSLLRALPQAQKAAHQEVFHLLESRRVYGRGIGWVDAHMLASALLSDCHLLTSDRRLAEVAEEIGVKLPKPEIQEQIMK